VRAPADPTSLAAEWRTLERAAPPTFFLSWHWIGTLLEALPAARRPSVLRGVAGGETVALGLIGETVAARRGGLVRSRRLVLNATGDPACDCVAIEHNGLLAAAGEEAGLRAGLLSWFAGVAADELVLPGVAPPLDRGTVAASGLALDETPVPGYVVDLRRLAPVGDFASLLSANARQQLRRARRRFEAAGALELVAAATTGEALAFFEELERLHVAARAGRGGSHAFSSPFFASFHRGLIERAFPSGAVQLLRCRAGSRVIGYLYNFRAGDRAYAYQSGFDRRDPRERPGAVAHAMAIEQSFGDGMRTYDFLAGRNRLKESFATAVEPMAWQIVQQPRFRFLVERQARRLKAALARRTKARDATRRAV